MGIVALYAIHFAFGDGVMLRQMKLRVHVHVALVTGLWILAGIDDELFTPNAAGLDVFAARSMTGFATVLAGHFPVFEMEPGMRAAGKIAGDAGMAIEAGFVTDEGCAFNHRRRNDAPIGGGTGGKEKRNQREAGENRGQRH